MANQPSLETVTSALNSWRENRPGRTGKTPAALRQQVLELLPFHSPSEIRRALKISGTMLKTWQQSKETIPEDPAQPAEFVTLASAPSPSDHSPIVEVRLRYPGGTELTLSGQLSPTHLAAVVQSLRQDEVQ